MAHLNYSLVDGFLYSPYLSVLQSIDIAKRNEMLISSETTSESLRKPMLDSPLCLFKIQTIRQFLATFIFVYSLHFLSHEYSEMFAISSSNNQSSRLSISFAYCGQQMKHHLIFLGETSEVFKIFYSSIFVSSGILSSAASQPFLKDSSLVFLHIWL